MEKERYENPKMEVVRFETENVILTSVKDDGKMGSGMIFESES